MPETTPAKSRRFVFTFGPSPLIGPKRSEFSEELGPRTHREDVADDSADAGGRALERLDRARMIVALHLERDRPAVADVDHAGVFFAGFDEHRRAGGGKFLQLAA